MDARPYRPPWLLSLEGRRIVVLGADGFIGSHVVRAGLAAGAEVVGLSVKEPWRLKDLTDDGRLLLASVPGGRWWARDYGPELGRRLGGADALVLLAYEPPQDRDEQARAEHELAVNAGGAAWIGELAARQDVRLVFSSSADVYGPWFARPVAEDVEPRPVTPYAKAKLAAERSLAELPSRGGCPIILRIATVFGPGEAGPRAIPSFVRAFSRGETPVVHGDGTDVKDYVHAGDVAAAVVNACAAGDGSDSEGLVLNVGSGRGRTTLEILGAVAGVMGVAPVLDRVPRARPSSRLVLATGRARSLLGFESRPDFERALAEEVEWLRIHLKMKPWAVGPR